MTDATQALLIIVITVLTAILTVIGIQVINILKEFRKTVQTVNEILADTEKVSQEMSNSFVEMAGIASGIKSALGIFNLFSRRREKKGGEKNE